MELNDGLSRILKLHLNWNKSRLDCFVEMLLALFRVRHFNLALLANAMISDATLESRYRRLQRFFSEVHINYDAVAYLIVSMFNFLENSFYLTLDRTNWKFGKKNINILTLAIVYRGAAIPVYWLILNKRGNSNQHERIALMKRFIQQFKREKILGILADREFIGQNWLAWLSAKNIPYWIRIKKNMNMITKKGNCVHVRKLFDNLSIGKSRILKSTRILGKQSIWLSGMKLENNELLIIISNQNSDNPFDIYGLRWEIETLFQSLKGRGFHMEDTRLVKYFRIKKFFMFLTIAFCWSLKTGEWKHKWIKPLKIKKHGRLEKSLFRYGLDYIGETLYSNKQSNLKITLRLLFLFLCPPTWIANDGSGIQENTNNSYYDSVT